LSRNPIHKVLFTLEKYHVKYLLIGGQACILYGAAEFSRDSDVVILCTPENITALKAALKALHARRIYVPPLELRYLERGHACHFRCALPDVKGLRIDVMGILRGCGPFEALWSRRKTVTLPDRSRIYIMGLSDLVQSKKTQRDKDWIMLTRLIENDIRAHRGRGNKQHIEWWLLECRVADTLLTLTRRYPSCVRSLSFARPLLKAALKKNSKMLNSLLLEEESKQRQQDKKYWDPLRKELELMRHWKI